MADDIAGLIVSCLGQIRYLAHRAHLSLEREGKTPKGGKPWVWEEGERMHTWMTGGRMGWVVGRRGDLDD